MVPKEYSTMYPFHKVPLPENLYDSFERKPRYQQDIMWPFHDVAHMTENDWRKANAYYRGFCTMIDCAIGEIFDALKKNGLWDNTMIVFVSDHGDMVGAHGRFDKGPYAYEEVMRIPMLVRIPGFSQRDIWRHVSIMDLNQTLVEWMELEPDIMNVDSRSLFPLIEQGDGGWSSPDEVFYLYEWYNGIWFGIRTIRTHEYKYCWNPAGIDELYDLKNDRIEMKNLFDLPEYCTIQEGLQEKLLDHLREIDDPLYTKMKSYI
jgi:arylsulfatase A-like enzyme